MPPPISQMPKDLAKRIAKIDKAIEKSSHDALIHAAKAAKAEQLDAMRADAGGDLRLSRVRSGKGATIGARTDLFGGSLTVKGLGPLPLIANPIKAHTIPKKVGKPISIPGIGARMSARHPGTKGKDTWNRGREKAEPKVTKAIAKVTDDAVRKAFLSGG